MTLTFVQFLSLEIVGGIVYVAPQYSPSLSMLLDILSSVAIIDLEEVEYVRGEARKGGARNTSVTIHDYIWCPQSDH